MSLKYIHLHFVGIKSQRLHVVFKSQGKSIIYESGFKINQLKCRISSIKYFFLNIFILIFVRPQKCRFRKSPSLTTKKMDLFRRYVKKKMIKNDRYKQDSLHHVNLNKSFRKSLARFKGNYLLQIAASWARWLLLGSWPLICLNDNLNKKKESFFFNNEFDK